MRRRTVVVGAIALAVVAAGVVVFRPQGGAPPATAEPIAATRGSVVVSVTGVGKVVVGGATTRPTTSGAGAGSRAAASALGGGAPVPGGAVYARASGRLMNYLVGVGGRARAGQPVAVIDDNGVAAAAVGQARNDLAAARLELHQKHTSDPNKGIPPTRRELVAAQLAIASARAKLTQVVRSPRAAEVSTARGDLAKAQADLEALAGGTPANVARQREIAATNVQLAQERLDRALAPASQADVSAAKADIAKAEADLVALKQPPGPTPAAVAAARQAVAAAQAKVSGAQAGGVAADISTAQLELDKANADLAVAIQLPPPPSPAALAAAEQAIEAGRQKLAKLLAPPVPADVTAARVELQRAQSELAVIETSTKPASLASARQAVAAAREKLAQLTGPPLSSDVKLARSDLGRAQADLAVLQRRGGPGSANDIQLAAIKVQAAEGRLGVATDARELLTVRASASGRVIALLSTVGSPVDPLTPMLVVEDLSKLAVAVEMSEFDIANVKPGLRAVASIDALGGRSFSGRVTSAAPVGNDSGGITTFPVRVSLRGSKGPRPGMTSSVRVIIAERRNVVRIPLDVVTEDDQGNSNVTLVDASGKGSTRRVTLGLANNKLVEVVKGLAPGDKVVAPVSAELP